MNRIAIALALLALAACNRAPREIASPFDDPQVLAVVGAERITKADLEAARVRRPIDNTALLDELIQHRALVQEARARGYDRDPETVAAVERTLANRVREEREKAASFEVTPAEIEDRYRADERKFALPAKIRAAMIFVEAPAAFTEEKRTERRNAIEAARAKAVDSPGQFAALAAEYSYDQATKYRGGDIGYLVEGMGAEELETPVITAAFSLKTPSDFSEIITTAKGFYFVKLIDRVDAAVRSLSAVAPQIRADLQREKQQRFETDLSRLITANRKIESRRDRLASMPDPVRHLASDETPTLPTVPGP